MQGQPRLICVPLSWQKVLLSCREKLLLSSQDVLLSWQKVQLS
jgi:hypothetical protein